MYQGITRKLPYRQMVTPHGVQVTFAKTVHIIFPSAVRYVDLGSKRFGIQFVVKGIYTYNGILYVHTQTKNSSNVPFDTDFIKFKIIDQKVAKRTAIQETVLDAVRSYNEVVEIG